MTERIKAASIKKARTLGREVRCLESARTLATLMPRLVRHGMPTFSSPDGMRFLGLKIPATGRVDGRFAQPETPVHAS